MLTVLSGEAGGHLGRGAPGASAFRLHPVSPDASRESAKSKFSSRHPAGTIRLRRHRENLENRRGDPLM